MTDVAEHKPCLKCIPAISVVPMVLCAGCGHYGHRDESRCYKIVRAWRHWSVSHMRIILK